MNRRDVFKALVGVATLGAVSASVKAAPKKYGCLTIQGHRHHEQMTGENLCVYLDGVEVLHVYEADDVEGYVLTLCRDEKDHKDWGKPGRLHIGGDGKACRMRLTGNVTFVPGPRKR